jgi:hypothetical protein
MLASQTDSDVMVKKRNFMKSMGTFRRPIVVILAVYVPIYVYHDTRLHGTPDRNKISIFFLSSTESTVQDFLHDTVHCSFTMHTLEK